jgi:hypothetical protein
MFHTWAKTRLTTAAVVLALLPVAHLMPALVALSILAAIVVALNVVEHTMVARTPSAQIR